MCGIAAYLGSELSRGKRSVERALELLRHRGPDDEGVYSDGPVVLGQRRLAIVDLSASAHQPMVSPDGRWALIYNGEVYNHLALRSRLCRAWTFRSHGDTETVLAALALHGPAALPEMVGMWALALWDRAEQRLLISRDRYGQKPLYWRRDPCGALRLASEIKPLLAAGERPEMFAPAVADFLATGNYGHFGTRCFFRDVMVFPPAHWAYSKPHDPEPTPIRYWQFPAVPTRDRRPYDATVRRQFRAAFEEAVDSQLMSDVPVGATLSGGLDSSAVVGAMASRRAETPIFTAQCADSAYDESQYVRAVDERWSGRLQIHWTPVRRMRIPEFLREEVLIQEEPFGDPSIAAHRQLMTAARGAGVPVILGGQGGDELLFGYPHMMCSLISSSLRAGRLAWAWSESRTLGLSPQLLARIGLSAAAPSLEHWLRNKARVQYRDWLSPALRDAATGETAELAVWSNAAATQLETVERVAIPHLTHYDDRSGMSLSVEGRMPFLDHRLADVLAHVDYGGFLHGGFSKRILRDACGDLLPKAVAERRDKIGFYTPVKQMLLDDFNYVKRILLDDFARELNLYDLPAVAKNLEQLPRGPEASATATCLWRVLAVRMWAEAFSIQPLAAQPQRSARGRNSWRATLNQPQLAPRQFPAAVDRKSGAA